jgi:hypothetical protein
MWEVILDNIKCSKGKLGDLNNPKRQFNPNQIGRILESQPSPRDLSIHNNHLILISTIKSILTKGIHIILAIGSQGYPLLLALEVNGE